MSLGPISLFRALGCRRLVLATALTLGLAPFAAAQSPTIRVVSDAAGSRVQVDGRDFMVLGMNWDYVPIGENYAYSLWNQPDELIRSALDREMSLLKSMGVNTVRQYVGIQPRWVRYIYEKYGIFTILNHPLGRYGATVGGVYSANTDYSNPTVRKSLVAEVAAVATEFRDTPGVLMYLLGNENNYGLSWKSAATENLPVGERDAAKARYLYSLMGEAITTIKGIDASRPVAMANGDVQYIDIIAQEAKGLDVFGTNVYRGISFRDLFDVVKAKLNRPVLFTEFGADAFNGREHREDQVTQARYLLAQWQEIYEHSSGKGLSGNAIGGLTFQWSDGWWKTGQETDLDIHDTNASWANDAYPEDFVKGENNMHEEWWGIMAKGPTDARGMFDLFPRAAYYALQQAYTLNPYGQSTNLSTIKTHFAGISPAAMVLRARGDAAAAMAEENQKVSLSGMRVEMSTYSTGGTLISTPPQEARSATALPAFKGFDHLESYYADMTVRPANNVQATMSVNVLGNVPTNPIDQLFYEGRGRSGATESGSERVKVYGASMRWDERDFRLDGFYRTGHYHWGYEGDFFGLYREANYGPNIDIYNGDAPLGMELTGKRSLAGLKVAFGPELWWGANPAVIGKYTRSFGNVAVTGMYQEDIAKAGNVTSSFAIPTPVTRKATLHLATDLRGVKVDVGGIWSGSNLAGRIFQIADGTPGNYRMLQDSVRASDAWGGKAKFSLSRGHWNYYVQGAAMGLVAEAGPTSTMTYTGWSLKDTGHGNQWNAITGATYTSGSWQIAPNFLYQKPIIGPVPFDVPAPGRPRNVIDDPFSVRGNREMVGGEMLVTYDPTPATYMYAWDNDMREDAKFAMSAGFVFRHLPTTQDAAIGILGDGRTSFAFAGATPARDLWEARARIVTKPMQDLRMILNLYGGTAEPNGNDQRRISRYGGDMRAVTGQFKLITSAKFNDWGPYDYHRDFNLTFPTQLMADISYSLGKPTWWEVPATRMGVRGTWRSLDGNSPRYCPAVIANDNGPSTCDLGAPAGNGREWEIRSYFTVAW